MAVTSPNKRHVPEPDHRVYTPASLAQEANLRYHNGAYRLRITKKDDYALHRTTSVAVRASLDPTAAPAPEALAKDYIRQFGHKGPGAYSYRPEQVASLIEDSQAEGAGAKPAPSRPTTIVEPPRPFTATSVRAQALAGAGVSGILGAEEQEIAVALLDGKRHFADIYRRGEQTARLLLHRPESLGQGFHDADSVPHGKSHWTASAAAALTPPAHAALADSVSVLLKPGPPPPATSASVPAPGPVLPPAGAAAVSPPHPARVRSANGRTGGALKNARDLRSTPGLITGTHSWAPVDDRPRTAAAPASAQFTTSYAASYAASVSS